MFDISFLELMLIGVVALLVLGPEKLPGAARTLGGLVRKARTSWNNVRGEIERELAADELKRSMQKVAREFDVTQDLKNAARDFDLSQDFKNVADTVTNPELAPSGDEETPAKPHE